MMNTCGAVFVVEWMLVHAAAAYMTEILVSRPAPRVRAVNGKLQLDPCLHPQLLPQLAY